MMKVKQFNVCLLFAALAQQTLFAAVYANPTGATVVNGQVAISQPNASTLQITNSPGAIINWQNFSIGAQELTRFVQDNSSSAILNRVVGGNASEILGKLQSNGQVYLINPNGLVIGQDAVINTAGFIGSTLNISNQDFLNGRLHFEGDNAADIDNQGFIRAGNNGDILLIAPNITNGGVLEVDGGNILLAAGQSITIASLDDANIQFEVQAAEDSVTNLGQIIADNGAANLFAGTLTHSGSISANGITTDAAGNIRLVAKDTAWIEGDITASGTKGGDIRLLGNQVGLDGNAVVDASGTNGGGQILIGGDYQGQGDVQTARASYVGENVQIKADAGQNGDGGRVIVWGNESTRMYGSISARGGALSGDGGFIETSGGFLDIGSNVPDVGAPNGVGGTWLLDPYDITIAGAGANPINITSGPAIFESTGNSAVVAIDTIRLALDNGDVIVQTGAGAIGTEAGNITWDAAATLIIDNLGLGKTLTLNAHNDIIINGDVGVQDPFDDVLNLTINADFDGDGQGAFILNSTADLFLSAGASPAEFKVDAATGINMLGNVNTSTNAGSLISLHTESGQIDSSGLLTTETLELSSTSAVNATINALSSSIANLGANMGAGSNINYRAIGAINLNAIDAVGGSLTIDTANAPLNQTGAIVTGDLIIVDADQVNLDNPANDVDRITATTNSFAGASFSYVDADDLVVGDVNVDDGSTSIGSSFLNITSGGDMTLDGDITTTTSGDPVTGTNEITLNAQNGGNIIHQSGTITSDRVNFQNDGNSTTTGAVGSATNPVQTAALNSSIDINIGALDRISGLAASSGDLFIRNTNGTLLLGEYLTPTPSILQMQNTAGDIDLQNVSSVDSAGVQITGELTAASIRLVASNGNLLLPLFGQVRPGPGARLTTTIGDMFLEGNNLSINPGNPLSAVGNITLVSNLGALTVDDLVDSSAGNIELIADSFVINNAITAQNQLIVREFNAINGLEVNDASPNAGFATLTTADLRLLGGTTQGILLGNNLSAAGNKSVLLASNIDSSMINGPRLTIDTFSNATGTGTARINANIDFTAGNENLALSGNGFGQIGPGSIPGDIVINTGSGNFISTAAQLDISGSADSGVILRTNDAGITGNLIVSSGNLAGSSALFTGTNLTLQGSLAVLANGDSAVVAFTDAVNVTSPSFVDVSAGISDGAFARLLGGNFNIATTSLSLLGGEGLNASAELRASGNIGINASGNILMQVGTAADTDAFISANGGLGTVVLNYADCQGCGNRLVFNPSGNTQRDVGIRALNISQNGQFNGVLGRLDAIPTLRALFERFATARLLRRIFEEEEDEKDLLICR